MRLGLFLSAQYEPGVDPGAALEAILEDVRLARDVGLSTVAAGQHFLPQPYWMFQPVPLLARLAAEAGEMRLATGVLLLPLLNPLEVAETVASLQVICGGRLAVGLGLGYRDEEWGAFAVGRSPVRAYEEKLGVLRGLLDGAPVTARGDGYDLRDAALAHVPSPRPPLWLAAVADRAVRRAGRCADGWYMPPMSSLDELERQVALFRAERPRGEPGELVGFREVLVAETDAEAVRRARPILEAKYATYAQWGQADELGSGWERLAHGRFCVGSAETVRAQLAEHQERLGTSEIHCRVSWPGSPPEWAHETIERLGRDVLAA
ncbi:MAG: LLM class flavin-dependent oxidoreductase [Thermoleophilia bacterium]